MSEPYRLDPTLLREYDIRGVVGRTLTERDALALGCAFAAYLIGRASIKAPERLRVCVARDGRLSSPALAAMLIEGLVASGVEVIDVGLGPTPMLYYAVHELKTDGGVMVTGSHNAPDYNGFKLTAALAKPVYGEAIKALGEIVAAGSFVFGAGSLKAEDLRDAYVARLRLGLPKEQEKPLKVGWDAGNGATGEVLTKLVGTLPGHHVVLNAAIDGRFPAHHPDPAVPENLAQLIATVRTERLDLGIAFDGDGDRIGVIDGQGRIVLGDQLVALLAIDVLENRKGGPATVILDVKSSAANTDFISSKGGEPYLSRTGHSLIKVEMAKTGAPLAGEMSGHIFFADDYYGFDDALYAAVRLLSLLGKSNKSLAALFDDLPKRPSTPELRIDCPDERKFEVVREVEKRLAAAGADVLDIDGVRVTTEDGWWLLRASNTQPALVARAEAKTPEGLERLKAALRRELAASGIAAPGF